MAQTAGTLDTTFGTGGTVTTIFTGDTMLPIGAVQQAGGDIVVLSQFDIVSDFGTQIGLTRYTSAGVLDPTFGTNGSTITKFSSFTFDPFALALEPNGDILVAGTVTTNSNPNLPEFGLARFTANGPSRPGELHPEALTDPCLSLSTHTARATQRRLPPPIRTIEFLRSPVDPYDPDAGDLLPSLHGHYAASSVLRSSPPLSGPSVLSASRGSRLRLFP